MRKWIFVLLLVIAMLMPTAARAQESIIINDLTVRLWPEYDDPRVLVIYDFTLAPGTAFPAEVTLRIPANAELVAVATEDVTGNLMVAPYSGPVADGDWLSVTIPVESQDVYRLEFYQDNNFSGDARNFTFTWPGDYAINTLVVQMLEPPQTSGFKATPALANTSTNSGFTEHNSTFNSLKAGTPWSISVSYSRPVDTLSVAGQNVQASETGDEAGSNSSFQQFIQQNLVLILAGVAIVLIVVGVAWFWVSGQESKSTGRSRKRHTAAISEGSVYCHECGKRASSGDKFCRACGVKLRKES